MPEDNVEIKKKPTALAQLIAIHMANGITGTKELSEETGYSDRAIRKAKAELECRNYSAARNQSFAQPGTIMPHPEPECRNSGAVSSRAGATKESSSKIVNTKEEENILINRPSNVVPLKTEQPKPKKVGPQKFDEFWRNYPRKVGKQKAAQAYARAIKIATEDEIIAGVKASRGGLDREDVQFIPHPATWLNAGHWMDEESDGPHVDHAKVDAMALQLFGDHAEVGGAYHG